LPLWEPPPSLPPLPSPSLPLSPPPPRPPLSRPLLLPRPEPPPHLSLPPGQATPSQASAPKVATQLRASLLGSHGPEGGLHPESASSSPGSVSSSPGSAKTQGSRGAAPAGACPCWHTRAPQAGAPQGVPQGVRPVRSPRKGMGRGGALLSGASPSGTPGARVRSPPENMTGQGHILLWGTTFSCQVQQGPGQCGSPPESMMGRGRGGGGGGGGGAAGGRGSGRGGGGPHSGAAGAAGAGANGNPKGLGSTSGSGEASTSNVSAETVSLRHCVIVSLCLGVDQWQRGGLHLQCKRRNQSDIT